MLTERVRYSEPNVQGIGYRVDFDELDAREPSGMVTRCFTTDQNHKGLWYHDGRGGQVQIGSPNDLYMTALRTFKLHVEPIIRRRAMSWD